MKTAKFHYIETLGSQQTTGEGEGRFDGPNTAMRMTLNIEGEKAHFLDQIQQAGTITKSGQTVLDGQPVSHYWVDLDMAKALDKVVGDAMPQDQRQKIANQVKTIPSRCG